MLIFTEIRKLNCYIFSSVVSIETQFWFSVTKKKILDFKSLCKKDFGFWIWKQLFPRILDFNLKFFRYWILANPVKLNKTIYNYIDNESTFFHKLQSAMFGFQLLSVWILNFFVKKGFGFRIWNQFFPRILDFDLKSFRYRILPKPCQVE